MLKVPTHKSLTALPRPQEGEIVYVEKEDRYFKRVNGVWEPTKREDVVSLGSVYDMNKQIISQMPALTDEQILTGTATIKEFVSSLGGTYYMLLCNEMKYYTVFVKDNGQYEMPEEVIACAKECGTLKSVSLDENGAVEIWVEDADGESHVMYFFNYDAGVVKCQ
jgi:hypothetical protein